MPRKIIFNTKFLFQTAQIKTSRAENEEMVAATGAPLIDLSERFASFAHPTLPGALRSLPHRTGSDGFFVASLQG